MEQTIDTKNIYDVMNCINMIVLNAKNPKSISNPKHQKAQDIVNEVKNSWKKYMEAVVLESILSKITFNKTCSEIKQLPDTGGAFQFYPWLAFEAPYTATGVTIYGSNNEVCDSF